MRLVVDKVHNDVTKPRAGYFPRQPGTQLASSQTLSAICTQGQLPGVNRKTRSTFRY